MTREELIELLNDMETQFPVSSWKINELDIWPILKIKLFFDYFNKHISQDTVDPFKGKGLRSKPYKEIAKDVWNYIRFRNSMIKKADVLFSGAGSYYTKFDDRMINKFFYPIEKLIKKENGDKIRFKYSVFGNHLSKGEYDNPAEIVFVENLVNGLKVLSKIKGKILVSKEKKYFPAIEKVYHFLKDNNLTPETSLETFEKNLKNYFTAILSYQNIYEKILRAMQPKLVMELCYYSKANFALNAVARKLSIPTLEIMHGGMGRQHPAYSGWENSIPLKGYNVMPEKIWVWDAVSKNLLDEWMSNQQFHSSFIGGQPWIDFLSEQSDKYSDYFTDRKKIILYTLQFDKVEDYIFEAIAAADNNFEWWLRLHPRKLYAKEDLLNKIKEFKIDDKVVVDAANSLPLPVILFHTHVHISEFSGSITEAALMGKYSLILNEIGVHHYQQLIDEGLCIPCTEKDASILLEKIYNIPERDKMVFTQSMSQKKIFNYLEL